MQYSFKTNIMVVNDKSAHTLDSNFQLLIMANLSSNIITKSALSKHYALEANEKEKINTTHPAPIIKFELLFHLCILTKCTQF